MTRLAGSVTSGEKLSPDLIAAAKRLLEKYRKKYGQEAAFVDPPGEVIQLRPSIGTTTKMEDTVSVKTTYVSSTIMSGFTPEGLYRGIFSPNEARASKAEKIELKPKLPEIDDMSNERSINLEE